MATEGQLMDMDVIYNLEEVAAILKTTPRTTRVWCNKGKIKAFKLGHGWRIHADDLQAFIDSARAGSTPK
jgi:excisionase family DNA binding protein